MSGSEADSRVNDTGVTLTPENAGDGNLVAPSDTSELLTDAAWNEISGDSQNAMEKR